MSAVQWQPTPTGVMAWHEGRRLIVGASVRRPGRYFWEVCTDGDPVSGRGARSLEEAQRLVVAAAEVVRRD